MMKIICCWLALIIASLVFVGCVEEKPKAEAVPEQQAPTMEAIGFTFEGHDYIVFENSVKSREGHSYSRSVVHDPDCKCLK